jgi:two-component system LytT family response regulator
MTQVPFESDKLVLPDSNGFNVFEFDNIIRLEADGCYTKVTIKDKKDKIVSRTLKDFEDSLPKDKFFRIHKSHLINLNYIKDYSTFSGNFVTMTDGSKIEISRRRAPAFTRKIKEVLKAV